MRRNFLTYRSPSLERSRNLINRNRCINPKPISVHTSVRLKEWLNAINHKWSQLISNVTTRHATDRMLVNGSGHHFSTLPRNHLINQQNLYHARQAFYDYARDGK